MTPMELTVVTRLMADQMLRSVFTGIARNRSVLFKDLREWVRHDLSGSALSGSGSVGNAAIENAIRSLKDSALIKERSAPIEDFNTYYVTKDGLGVERQLRLVDPALSS